MTNDDRNIQLPPPFKIKMTSPIKLIPEEERIKALQNAFYNLFYLQSRDVFIDLLTDSGTGGMSDKQYAGMMTGDEAYAGSASFEKMKKSLKDILGFDFIIPTHQGRAAENVFNTVMLKDKKLVPGNKHFDTTKAHIEYQKGEPIDVTISSDDVYYNPKFKGNLNLDKLNTILSYNYSNISYILITTTCNSNGGQPVSMENIESIGTIARQWGFPLFMDIARYAENAYFIQQYEDGYKNKSIKEIAREMMSHADGALMSAKKDAIVNMGGFIALRSAELCNKLKAMSTLFEGLPTYGGMSGMNMEALAQGLYDCIDQDYITYRVNQVAYLGNQLDKYEIPMIKPFGGHAIFIDSAKFLPHIPQSQFPGQALVCELYLEGGVRGVEVGSLLSDRDPVTGDNRYPELELIRLCVPHKSYTNEHLAYVAKIVKEVWNRRKEIKGMEITYEEEILRHFTAKLRPIE